MSLFSIFSKKTAEPTSVAEALAGVGESPTPKSKSRRSEKRDADAQNEQLVPEKKRARRRLIGAVAIVLAVVIGLPMVLDSEPKPLNKNIVIQIPSKDSSASTVDSKDDPNQDESGDQSAKTSPSPVLAVADTPERTVTTVTPTPAAPPAATPKADKKFDGKVDNKADNKSDAKSDNKRSADTNTKKDSAAKSKTDSKSADSHAAGNDDARAVAILTGADPSAKSTTRIVVQVGAFATQEKVSELQDKLTAAGIKSFTQKVATSSGDKIRVRVGPFSDKESADKMKLQLEKIGLTPSLVSL
jgi:DedD protein